MRTKTELIHQLAGQLGYPDSENLYLILNRILTEVEARWMVNLPNNPHDLALKLGMEEITVINGLQDLFMRGLVLVSSQTSLGPLYIVDNNPGRFMDMVLFDPRYQEKGEEFYTLWRKFFNDELVFEPRSPDKLPFRIILPVDKKIEDKRAILPYEQVSLIIQNANKIVVQNCPCRTRERRCRAPLETCISLDKTAEYMLSRNIGRQIGISEALQILKHAEELGLVHETDNTDNPTIICNCCSCCCVFLRAITFYQQQNVIARSRFAAQVDQSKCVLCRTCLDRCHFKAISITPGGAFVNPTKCYGCGLCSTTCHGDAIRMIIKRPADTIPHDGDEFMQGLTSIPFK
ncbi:MAG: hypothetical protein PHI59_09620 [Candidatus Omnitrophica bacterium]|nr:hypothetical protein [Candidatus Omnitrophota bacterium]